MNVRVSSLTLFGALVSTQAPTPRDPAPPPAARVHIRAQHPRHQHPAGALSQLETSRIGETERRRLLEEELRGVPEGPCWLLQLCVSLVTQPREELYSDSDAGGSSGASLEPSPVDLKPCRLVLCL